MAWRGHHAPLARYRACRLECGKQLGSLLWAGAQVSEAA
ncbi:hypothetical protein XCR_4470 [Xanthomonas campestris pv. raphani 756C]|nr:hypothetical protein XCR_4470 [Xanthomonas campestris pv. raphani 756C]